MTRAYQDYLHDMLDAIDKAQSWIQGLDLDEFEAHDEKVFAVTRALEIIGEAARHIPLEIQTRYPAVPWADMIGMRNIMIHGYFGVDNEVIWRTVQEDLAPLHTAIKHILDEVTRAADEGDS